MRNNNTPVIDDHIALVLAELGLNEYESRAYLTVLEDGIVVAREVSDKSSIPYAKVYQVLENLIVKQFIIGDEGRPRKFRCRDPREAMDNRLQFLEEEFQIKQEKRSQLINTIIAEFSSIYSVSKSEVEEEQTVWTIYGLANILQRLYKLIKSAQSTIRILSFNPKFVEEKFMKLLNSVNSSIKMSFVLETNNQKLAEIGEVFVLENLGFTTQIIIDQSWRMNIAELESGKFSKGEFQAVLTNIQAIVRTSVLDYDRLISLLENVQ